MLSIKASLYPEFLQAVAGLRQAEALERIATALERDLIQVGDVKLWSPDK